MTSSAISRYGVASAISWVVTKDGPASILSFLSFPGLQKELEMKDAVLAELKEEAAKKDQETRNDLRCDLRHNQHESYSRYSHSTRLLMRPFHCLRALYKSSSLCRVSWVRVKCAPMRHSCIPLLAI